MNVLKWKFRQQMKGTDPRRVIAEMYKTELDIVIFRVKTVTNQNNTIYLSNCIVQCEVSFFIKQFT